MDLSGGDVQDQLPDGFPTDRLPPGLSGPDDGWSGGGDPFGTASTVVGAVGGVGVLLLALVGVGFVVGGIALVVRSRRRAREVAGWRRSGRTTTGVVVDNRTTSHGEHRLTFQPVVRFEADGREVVVVGDQTSHRSFVVGRPAQVVHDPAAPERAGVLAEGGSAHGGTVGGVVLAVAGVVFLLGLGAVAGLGAVVLSLV